VLDSKRFADAERLLLQGYEGMKARQQTIPAPGILRIYETLERLVALFTDWHAAEPDKGDDAKAAEWKRKLDDRYCTT
jgi:eukaryotic-like serine/threonine-protein kinase